jgi:uncharacterized phage protein (TIGR01671 family)
MRELKFRAWDGQRMMYKELYDRSWYGTTENDEEGCHYVREVKSNDKRNLETMQYTGLKDNNSKEIYQKDLLGGTWGDGYIDYCDKCKSFEYFDIDGDCMSCEGDVSWRDLVEEDGKFEVIGNIYENSDLLKGV